MIIKIKRIRIKKSKYKLKIQEIKYCELVM